MSWTKERFMEVAKAQLEDEECHLVYVEGKATKEPFLESSDIAGAFFNAATNLDNGNKGALVGFKKDNEQAAVDFSNNMQARDDVIAVDGPHLKA